MERFGCSPKDIRELRAMAIEGKVVQVHAQVSHKSKIAKEDFVQALACFLIGAEQFSYFGAGKDWNGYSTAWKDGDQIHDKVLRRWLKVNCVLLYSWIFFFKMKSPLRYSPPSSCHRTGANTNALLVLPWVLLK